MAYMSSKEDSDDSDNNIPGLETDTDTDRESSEDDSNHNTNHYTELANAIRVNDAKRLRQLILKKPGRLAWKSDSDSVYPPALHLLVQHKTDTTELRAILNEVNWLNTHIDEEAPDRFGEPWTPLSYLCANFHDHNNPHGWSTLEWLLERGADPRLPLSYPAIARAIHATQNLSTHSTHATHKNPSNIHRQHDLVTRLLPLCRINYTHRAVGPSWLVKCYDVIFELQDVILLDLLYTHFEMPRECLATAVSHGKMLLVALDRMPKMKMKKLINEPLEVKDNARLLDVALSEGTLSLVYALVARGASCRDTTILSKFKTDVLLQAVSKCWRDALRQFLRTEQLVLLVVEMLAWPAAKTILSSAPLT